MIYFGFHFFYHIPSESEVYIQYVSIHIKNPLIYECSVDVHCCATMQCTKAGQWFISSRRIFEE